MRKKTAITIAAVSLLTLVAVNAFAADVTWNVAGDGDWDTTTANWTGVGGLYADGDNVTFDNAAGGTITVLGMSPASTTVNAADGVVYTFVTEVPTVAGADSILTGALVKNGAGTLQLGAFDLNQPWNNPIRQSRT